MDEMQATWVEDEITPLPYEEVIKVTSEVLSVYIKNPSEKVVSLFLGKSAQETARWGINGRGFHRNNFGNQKALSKHEGMYTTFWCDENLTVKGVKKRYVFHPDTPFDPSDPQRLPNPAFPKTPNPPGHIQTRFRAFANPYDGMYEYMELISNSKRYAPAWTAMQTGDPNKFVHALAIAGYFTANEGDYLKGVISLQNEFLKRIRNQKTTEMPVDEIADIAKYLPMSILSLDDLYGPEMGIGKKRNDADPIA